jgi:hypothetical protein
MKKTHWLRRCSRKGFCFGEIRKQAIILLGCYHKAKVYTPADALE